jgi:hypothetical protein
VAERCWRQSLNLSVLTPVLRSAVPTRLEQMLVPLVAAELGPSVMTSAPPARMTNGPVMAATVRTQKNRFCKGMAFPFVMEVGISAPIGSTLLRRRYIEVTRL